MTTPTEELAKKCGMYQGTATTYGSDTPSFYAEAHQLQAFRDACVKEATEELQARIAMQDEALKEYEEYMQTSGTGDDSTVIYANSAYRARRANSEDVAAWQEKREKEVAARAKIDALIENASGWDEGSTYTGARINAEMKKEAEAIAAELRGETK